MMPTRSGSYPEIMEVFDYTTEERVNTSDSDSVSKDGKSGREGSAGPCLKSKRSVLDDNGLH